ncbi:MAG TPA: ThiF family adenylyltransferase [Kiritimatiellia bacterium]|nr:ThiF family adenylyltransferase [Kiritimatiellia bacterium]
MTTPFARLELLLGPDALPRLANARVVIAGLGAVGAAAAESLARSAVGRLVLVDFDELRPSNINRHPFAFHSTIGTPKAETAARFLRDIHPAADIVPLSLFLDAETSPKLFADHPCDVLIDAIDSLLPKTELLLAARAAGVPRILTCLGAARKTDPTRFVTADLADSHTCPLARLLRKRLGRRGGTAGIRAVFSTEPPLDPTEPVEPAADFYIRGRLRPPMGSLHACTAAAGLLAARETLRFLLEETE